MTICSSFMFTCTISSRTHINGKTRSSSGLKDGSKNKVTYSHHGIDPEMEQRQWAPCYFLEPLLFCQVPNSCWPTSISGPTRCFKVELLLLTPVRSLISPLHFGKHTPDITLQVGIGHIKHPRRQRAGEGLWHSCFLCSLFGIVIHASYPFNSP